MFSRAPRDGIAQPREINSSRCVSRARIFYFHFPFSRFFSRHPFFFSLLPLGLPTSISLTVFITRLRADGGRFLLVNENYASNVPSIIPCCGYTIHAVFVLNYFFPLLRTPAFVRIKPGFI